MRFLLDTHTWLWAISAPERLRHSGGELIADPENTILFSAVSALEIAIKGSLGKLTLPEPAWQFVPARVESFGMSVLPIYMTHSLRVASLPQHHGDPFDRLLVAQCQIERVPLMTADAAIGAYDIEILWVGQGRGPQRKRRRAT
jgi:PIN domain nuclease of toxin-antitoxin system